MTCPSADTLQAYCEGRCEAGAKADVAAHLETCEPCRAAVLVYAATRRTRDEAAAPVGARAASDELAPGESIGRFIVMHRLGEGGMGVVYAAYDPDLDRKIALKLIRRVAGERDADGRELQERLMREAQAMARVTHSNVVAVHEVGRHQQHLFIAMEFVAGETLASWLVHSGRATAQIVRVFVDAGRGLAAAHAAGLVHRDFKPNNVMIDREGRVRVLDFGLARSAADVDLSSSAASPRPSTSTLTATGMLVGTPAYMAPEQLMGRRADARTDQFSFCVALYEALAGVRPFVGADTDALRAAIAQGRRQRPQRKVPGWLLRIVERGLAAEPDARWPSMDALLAALGHDPAAVARRWLALGGAAALAATLIGATQLAAHRHTRLCRGADERVAQVWNDSRRQALRAAFAATKVSYGADAATGVIRVLDDYARHWAAMSTDSCKATHVRGEQSQEALDLRTECLDQRRQSLSAMVDVFTDADAKVVARSLQAVQALEPIAACADVAVLKQPLRPPSDPAARDRLAQIRRQLEQVKALTNAGKYAVARPLADAAAVAATALAYKPLEAETRFWTGRVAERDGRYKDAEAELVRAAAAAIQGRDDELAARSWSSLVFVVGSDEERPADAEPWLLFATAAVERSGSMAARSSLLINRYTLLYEQGRYDEALEVAQKSLVLREKLSGPESAEVAVALSQLANILDQLHRYDEALACFRRLLALREKLFGAHHPDLAAALNNCSILLRELGRFDEALAMQRRALAIREETLGPQHPEVADSLAEMGGFARHLGRPQDAIAYTRRALAIREVALGPAHPRVAGGLGELAVILADAGRHDEALRVARQSLALRQKVYGTQHPDVAFAFDQLAYVLRAMSRHEEALAAERQALAIVDKLAPGNRGQAEPLLGIGLSLLALHSPKAALAPLERLLSMHEQAHDDPGWLAGTRFALAQALWDSGGDRTRARSLAQQAAGDGARATERDLSGQIDAWLLHHSVR